MKKIIRLHVIFLSLVFIYSCDKYINIKTDLFDLTKNLSDNKEKNNSNVNNLSENKPTGIDIKILNPSNKSESNWYKKNDKTIVMKISSQANLYGTVTLNDGSKSSNVTWSSSDTTIATINNGVVSASKIGTTTVLAVSNVDSSYKEVLNIEVMDEANFSSVDSKSINNVKSIDSYISTPDGKKNNIKLKLNSSISALSVVTLNDDTKNSNVIWESSDETVATVSSDGKITAKKNGVTTIVSKYKLNPDFKSLIVLEVDDILDNVASNIIDSKFVSLPNIIYPSITPIPVIAELPTPLPTKSPEVIILPTIIPSVISIPTPLPTKLPEVIILPANLVLSKTEFKELDGNLDNIPSRGETLAIIPTFTNIGGIATNRLKVKISTSSLYAKAENVLYNGIVKVVAQMEGTIYTPKAFEYGLLLREIQPNGESVVIPYMNSSYNENCYMILKIEKTVLSNTKIPVIYSITDDYGNSWSVNDEILVR